MVKIADYKSYTEHKPIETPACPALVYIPVSQHVGKPCTSIEVKVGDKVLTGQKIASAETHPFVPVHSSVSGIVRSIQPYHHPVLGICKTIVIENDYKDTLDSNIRPRTKDQINGLGPKEIRSIVFNAGIAGMGGASFPTHIKLDPPKKVHTLIVNIAECEPYLTADSRLATEKANEIIAGIGIVKQSLPDIQTVIIAIEENKQQAIAELRKTISSTPYRISVLKTQYPQGWEKQLIKRILNIEVPRAKLPFDAGVIVQNAATVFSIYEAVYMGKPLYERVVTVSGKCLFNPKNLLCRIGTPVKNLIDFCGPLNGEPSRFIIGGPMMGIAQYTWDAPVIKSTTGVVLFDVREARILEEKPCIRCGACVRECPVNLAPCLIKPGIG